MRRGFNFPPLRLWRSRRRARIENISAEAEALVRDLGQAAYAEARKRQDEASSDAIAKDWERVALAVARKLGSPAGPGAGEGAAARPASAPDRDRTSPPARRVSEPKHVLDARPQSFRIQYVGPPTDRGSSILKEVEIQVLDVSSAIVEAANLAWPPRTIALRILDRDGREVFERHKADLR